MSDERFWVRVAESGDVAKIVELNHALFGEDAGRRDPLTDQDWPLKGGEEYFIGFLGQDRALCLLVETSEAVAGYLAGYVRDGTSLRPVSVAELESMYVVEQYRNLGLGTRMVGEFLGWAGVEGAEVASVTAYAANERAIRFYQRHGFVLKSTSLERAVVG